MSEDPSSGLPPGLDIPDTVTATADASGQALDSSIQMIPFPFCLSYQGSNWQKNITVAAPSPELAATTAGQMVSLLNAQAVRLGYPAGFSCASGACG